MFFGLVSAVISVIAVIYYLKSKDTEPNGKNLSAWIVLALAFIFRIATFWAIKGYETDIGCFTGWSESAYFNGLSGFYAGTGFADYPPGYVYVLYVTGFIADIFNIDTASLLYNFILKLPSMVADILTAWVIYDFAKTKVSHKQAATLCAVYAFNPLVYLTSALWGQVDSVFTLAIIVALVLLYNKKQIASACVYAVALLIKPQALVLFPIYILYIISFVKNEGINAVKTAVISVVSGMAVFFALIIPFSLDRGLSWIFELYYNTLSSYPYATLNAPNFYGMIGANGADMAGTTYSMWSFGFIILICAICAFVYFKGNGDIFESGAVLVSGMYILSAKMHERYIFPLFALMLIMAVTGKKKYPIIISSVFSLTTFMASAKVLSLSISGQNPWINPDSVWFIAISAINVVAFVAMIYQMIRRTKWTVKSQEKMQ